jgi:hypothetical protein
VKSEAERWREEREFVERKRPWLAFSRPEPVQPKPAQRDHFVWLSVAELAPVEGE